MSATAPLKDAEGFRSDAERKKRLGQYFTGVRLARLLAALAGAHTASSVIDPMVGTGDMLIGCLDHGAQPRILGAIEIDPIAKATCARRLREAGAASPRVLLGDAFSPETIKGLPTTAWDVCITNPPYVRYQSVAHAAIGEMPLPSALEVRQRLIASIDELTALDDEDKRLFKVLAHGYSGLADLAVPSWILCAGLVRVGGTLAMLVPTTWLNRDYAYPVQYLLARWFDTQYIVEDADATWFSDALVRTTLVVATRVERRGSAFTPPKKSGHLHLNLDRNLSDERSIVGAVYPEEDDPDLAFALDAERWHAARRVPKTGDVTGHWVPASYVVASLEHATERDAWLRAVEPRQNGSGRTSRLGPAVPLPLRAAVGKRAEDAFGTLDDIGWRVGQGLRTGANQFFYAETRGRAPGGESVVVATAVGGGVVEVPQDALRPVLRRQADLPEAFSIRTDGLRGRVLVLSSYALPEDLDGVADSAHHVMPASLAEHVRRVATTNVGTEDEPKFIPELSAVVTNIRQPDPARPEVLSRFWYQLPAFSDRHRPSLAVARVNHTHPKTYSNDERAAIIDANFSTLWPLESATVDEHALLAVMNSMWSIAAMELACTVLGGGALKVEAAHLRRLPIPTMRAAAWRKLSALGQRLADAPAGRTLPVLARIDAVVIEELVGRTRHEKVLTAVKKLATERLVSRSR